MKGPARNIERPEPGLFLTRLCKGGPLWPCKLVRRPTTDPLTGEPLTERYWPLWAILGDRPPSLDERDIDRIWTYGRATTGPEYAHLIKKIAWCRQHRPHDPICHPFRPIDREELLR